MTRRTCLAQILSSAAAAAPLRAETRRAPHILLRGSWQSVNIGDIGHTPGALWLLERYYPQAKVTLWPNEIGNGARELLAAAFPKVQIVEGKLDANGKPDNAALAQLWKDADFLLHGSSSGFSAEKQVKAWKEGTGKPYGMFGISGDPLSGFGKGKLVEGGTLDELRARINALPADHMDSQARALLDGGSFVFCRDSITVEYFKKQGIRSPVIEFGPDATFAIHLRNDQVADQYLRSAGLEPQKFICVIPRLRYTPYYRIRHTARTPEDDTRDAINAKWQKSDHERLRGLIVAWVKNTGNKVLACPEMTYQVELAKEELVDPLPAEIRKQVVWRDKYWLPDEAASVYARAQAVVSMECHSPIISLANGTPAFYVRQPTDTIKGQMYRDIGVPDWFFEVQETSGEELWSHLKKIQDNPAQARKRVAKIMDGVRRIEKHMVDTVHSSLDKRRQSASAASRSVA